MPSSYRHARLIGLLFLTVFICGVFTYQVLRGPYVFDDSFLTLTVQHETKIISSVLVSFFSGIISIVIAALFLPLFKRYSETLAYLYMAFCIVNFVAIFMESSSVLALLEFCKQYGQEGSAVNISINGLSQVYYEGHRWSHYIYLLLSCLPVFVLYLILYKYLLVPRWIGLFGMLAAIGMFLEILLSMVDMGISQNLMLPMAIIQLVLPVWLIIKGVKETSIHRADA